MSWFGKSNYKKSKQWNWWEHEVDHDANEAQVAKEAEVIAEDDYYGRHSTGGWGTGGGYSSYNEGWYKPKFDLSVSVEIRVKQLIKTITGKDLKLVRAHGWGVDDKYFYYNADDLQEASDDEILGRIMHQVARELFFDKISVKNFNAADPDYRHLLNTLEDNRADNLLQKRYMGAGYYAAELWDARKFTDNPMNRYKPQIRTKGEMQDYFKQQHSHNMDMLKYEHDKKYKDEIDRLVADENKMRDSQYNDAWEFCFNINALQNGEEDFDFLHVGILENFKKAVPLIQQYLDAPTLAEAMVIYPEIKKYYPKPNKQQQDQMDREMSQSEGLTTEQMERLRADAQAREAHEAQRGDSGSQDAEGVYAFGLQGSLDDGDMTLESNMAEYKRIMAEKKPLIHSLHYLIRSIIKDNEIKRFTRPFKRGKIDAKRMYKYLATDNLRIFKKKRVISDKKYTMSILVDQSGSMQGQNSEYAVQGAIVLAEVFEMLGLPYEIIGFDNKAYIFKKYNAGLKREYIPSLKTSMGGTDDANALQTAKERMMKFDPSNNFHKGIFIISDGEGADPAKMKDLVTDIEKTYNATVFGLGIGDMPEAALQQSYNHYLKIRDIKELPRVLVDLMKSQFRRG